MDRKKLLITGFDPFGEQSINPSWYAVEQLPDTVGEYGLCKLAIPTVFGEAARRVLDKARALAKSCVCHSNLVTLQKINNLLILHQFYFQVVYVIQI